MILQTYLQPICKWFLIIPSLQQTRKQAKEVYPAMGSSAASCHELSEHLGSVSGLLAGWKFNELFTHQHVDSTAHAVFFVLVMHDSPIIQKSFHQAHDEFYKSFSCFGEVLVLPAVFQEAEK